jgi:hypothetical protein
MKMKTLSFIVSFITFSVLQKNRIYAYGECEEFGYMATYNSLTDSCECMSGYVMEKNTFGDFTCVSGNSVCSHKYGLHSRYDSLSNSCECSYGYTLGKDSIGRTQCISQDEVCRNQLGFSSRYNSLSGKCECQSGYVIYNGKCSLGSTVCTRKHGIHSSYDRLSNSCECNDDYTLDDSGTCVEKQHNVYFTLIEIDTDNKEAIIKSDYDYKYYRIKYGIGCLSSTFERYENEKIVVNLGTDYFVDTFDTVVLQDDDQVCDILRVARADSNSTLFSEPEKESNYIVKKTPITRNSSADRIPEKVNLQKDNNAGVIDNTEKPLLNKFIDYIRKLFK